MPATMSLSLPVIDETDAVVETLKFLSDGNRLRILRILSQRESCVCELIEQIGLTQPLASYHLRKLRDAGLVRTRRKAQWVYYSIEPTAWRSLIAPVLNHYLVTEFPLEAAYGASNSCDTKIPSRALGASEPNGTDWSED
ncbi:MAG: transcriptional regulator, ArsR family [Thermomicrobiales bacterium]|nr:transcriptional regulator, ArsR family [Thermomicrobiales bacterium]